MKYERQQELMILIWELCKGEEEGEEEEKVENVEFGIPILVTCSAVFCDYR